MMQLPEYPFSPRCFRHAHGANQRYLDEGAGPVVVMLHGNPTWSYYYRHLVLALRGSHRCIVPDHIGMGWSDKPDDAHYTYSLPQRVADLDALIASLDLGDRITLVVHDWGGLIGFAWACRYPERVARLVILNTAAFPLPDGVKLPALLRASRGATLGPLLLQRLNALARGATRLAVKHAMPREVRAAYLAPYGTAADRLAILRFVQDIAVSPTDRGFELAREIGAKLPQFATRPALVGWGMADPVFDARFLGEFRRALPAAEVHEYAGCGHYVLEDARDQLIPDITRFLARTA